MGKVYRLDTSPGQGVVRACSTCRHRNGERCGAGGSYINTERSYDNGVCGTAGRMWEAKPPKIGVWGHIKRFWLGDRE